MYFLSILTLQDLENVPSSQCLLSTTYSVWKLGERILAFKNNNDSAENDQILSSFVQLGKTTLADNDNVIVISVRQGVATRLH